MSPSRLRISQVLCRHTRQVERARAGHRGPLGERGKIASAGERRAQPPAVFGASDLDRAEGRQMFGEELGVEQPEAAEPEPRDEMDERDF